MIQEESPAVNMPGFLILYFRCSYPVYNASTCRAAWSMMATRESEK